MNEMFWQNGFWQRGFWNVGFWQSDRLPADAPLSCGGPDRPSRYRGEEDEDEPYEDFYRRLLDEQRQRQAKSAVSPPAPLVVQKAETVVQPVFPAASHAPVPPLPVLQAAAAPTFPQAGSLLPELRQRAARRALQRHNDQALRALMLML